MIRFRALQYRVLLDESIEMNGQGAGVEVQVLSLRALDHGGQGGNVGGARYGGGSRATVLDAAHEESVEIDQSVDDFRVHANDRLAVDEVVPNLEILNARAFNQILKYLMTSKTTAVHR